LINDNSIYKYNYSVGLFEIYWIGNISTKGYLKGVKKQKSKMKVLPKKALRVVLVVCLVKNRRVVILASMPHPPTGHYEFLRTRVSRTQFLEIHFPE